MTEHTHDEEMPPSYPPKKDRPKQKLSAFFAELSFVIVAALIVSVLIKTFLVQAFYIPSTSMTNTLEAVSYTHLTLPTILRSCRSRWSPYH